MSREVILELIGIAAGVLVIIFRKHFRHKSPMRMWGPPATPFEQALVSTVGGIIVVWGIVELFR